MGQHPILNKRECLIDYCDSRSMDKENNHAMSAVNGKNVVACLRTGVSITKSVDKIIDDRQLSSLWTANNFQFP